MLSTTHAGALGRPATLKSYKGQELRLRRAAVSPPNLRRSFRVEAYQNGNKDKSLATQEEKPDMTKGELENQKQQNGASTSGAHSENGAHKESFLRREWFLKDTPNEIIDLMNPTGQVKSVAQAKAEKASAKKIAALSPAEHSSFQSWLLKDTPQEVLDLTNAYKLGYKGRPHSSVPWPMKRSWTEIFLDRLVDTADDVGQHMRRQVMDLPSTRALNELVARGTGQPIISKSRTKKPVVAVLGFGWGAHALIKVIDVEQYDVVVISPRNFFLFTPMLPSTAVGTVEFRSLLEPIRIANPFVEYCAATCTDVDLERKVLHCTSAVAFEDGLRPEFELRYDILVCGQGEQPATFGVKGVEEYAYFMKEVSDTKGLRTRIQEMFELASLPGTSEEEKKRILHAVVVGGGPTGVEFSGTLSDFVRDDLSKKYPELMPYVRISLLQGGPAILMQFDPSLAERAVESLTHAGVEVRLNTSVVEVGEKAVTLKNKDGEVVEEGYGICVWSAGNATRPLTKALVEQIPEQAEHNTHPFAKKLAVDPYMRVIGAEDVIAIGDCSKMVGSPLPPTAQVASQQGAYIAHYINRRFAVGEGGMAANPPNKLARGMRWIDKATGSVDIDELTDEPVVYYKKPFEFLNLGILAYLGNGKALSQVVAFDKTLKFSGDVAFFLWRSVYITKQVSLRNRVLILFDWLKTRVFGRDLSQF